MRLMTIGYEGLTTEQFFAILIANRAQTIVDVRELPLSRKPGFSKRALAAATSAHELNYVHMPALGCPREIRHDYRADRDWARYTRRFLTYLSTRDEDVAGLTERVRDERCVLLCYEADFNFCHRSIIAQRVAEVTRPTLIIEHLSAQTARAGRLTA